MERQILCRSPRGRQNRVILRIIISALGFVIYSFCVHALEPPTVVIEDTLTLGVNVKTVEFDTTHFGEPSLLVGTVKDGNGDCFVIRVRTSPPEIAETLYTFQSVPLLVRAGFLDADAFPDLLVSLDMFCPNDSPSYSSVVLHGPDFELADTICFRSYLRDAIIDDSSHEVWLAYAYTASWIDTMEGGYPWTYGASFTTGAMIHLYDISNAGTQDTLIVDVAAVDIARVDIDDDHVAENVAFWQSHSSSWSSVSMEPGMEGAALGLKVSNAAGDSVFEMPWWTRYVGGWDPIDLRAELMVPVQLLDGNHDGVPEALTAALLHSRFSYYPTYTRYTVALRSLTTADSAWSRELPTSYIYKHPSASLWDLDMDGALDVLVSHRIVTEFGYNPPTTNSVLGLAGATGDSLFYFELPYYLEPVVVGALDNSGLRKGVLVRGDTLFVFHLDFSPNGADGDEPITPAAFELSQNYPNPFNAQTHIEYEINRPVHVALNVYDILGRYVTTLVDAPQTTGQHDATWNGRDADGIPVSSGVYFYRMKSGDADQVRKMLLLK